MMDFTGFVLAALAGLVAPPVLLAALWWLSRGRGASRPARVAACAALALLGTVAVAAAIGAAWREDGAMLVAPATLSVAAAVALRSRWSWALPPLGLLGCWLVLRTVG